MEVRTVANTFGQRMVWGIALAALTCIAADVIAQSPTAGRINGIFDRFEKGEPSFNGEEWQLLPDLEHNAFRLDDVERALNDLKPAGATRPVRAPVVRIPYEADQDYRHYVKQLLDSGVMGIIVPGVETAEQALALVRSMRYPPQRVTKKELQQPAGYRGWGAGAASAFWGVSQDVYAAKADVWPLNPQGELIAIAMIESPLAVKNIRKILGVPGLGAILIGQADLSMALGVGNPGANPNHPEVEAEVAKVAQACVEMKKLCGSYQGDIKTRLAQGFRLFTARRQ